MKILFFISACLISLSSYCQTHWVTNLNAQGSGSLRQVIDQAPSGSTIRFQSNLLDSGPQTLTLDSNIIIDKDLTIKGLINGSDTLTISGGDSTRIFKVENTNYLQLDSLVLEHGYTPENGGGILFLKSGLLTLNYCEIRNCSANSGGGIYGSSNNKNYVYIQQDSLTIDTTVTLQLYNTYIHDNSAEIQGGGILFLNNGTYTSSKKAIDAYIATLIKIDYSTISNNYAGEEGGGILQSISGIGISAPETTSPAPRIELYTYGFISVNQSSIYNNEAHTGGGIYNTVATHHISMNKGGHAIFFNHTKVNLINSTLFENKATLIPEIYSATYTAEGPLPEFISDRFNIEGSIIKNTAQNAYKIGSDNEIHSTGYNIFSEFNVIGSHPTDQIHVLPEQLNLGEPDCYGESRTPNLLPQLPSIAINQGNPNNVTSPQTGYLYGTRDIGSSETCKSFSIDERIEYNAFTWINDSTYTEDDSTATFTLENSYGCDSVVYLDLKIIPLQEMSVFPNPVQSNQDIDVFIGNNVNKPYTVEIVNLNGRVMQTHQVSPTKGKNQIHITKPNLQPGVYFINNSYSKKSTKLIVL